MDSEEIFESEYENLNDAILQAIVASKEVKKILIRLKEESFEDIAILNLFLSLDELYEMISGKNNSSIPYKLEPIESKQLQRKEKKVNGL